MNFIYDLYQNDNFTLYLTIALVVLIILFVIVLLFGKRDQKLEETKRLQKIELEKDGFKEETEEPKKLEVEETKELTTKDESLATVTEFEPNVKEKDDEEINLPEIKEEAKPLFMDNDDAPMSIDELPEVDFSDIDLEKDLSELEDIKKKFDDINVPTVEEKKEFKPSEVYSSVFVNEAAPLSNEEEKITLFEDKKEDLVVETPKVVTSFSDYDEEDFELPSLKEEDKKEEFEEPVKQKEGEKPLFSEEEPDIKPFSFDDITGETYNLK